MRRSQSAPVVIVKVLVEEDVITEVRISLKLGVETKTTVCHLDRADKVLRAAS